MIFFENLKLFFQRIKLITRADRRSRTDASKQTTLVIRDTQYDLKKLQQDYHEKIWPQSETNRHSMFLLFDAVVSLSHRLHPANTVTLDMHTREEFLSASKDNSKLRTIEKTSTIRKREEPIVANTTLSSMDESFWLENLNVSSPVQCGANKCFFEVKSDPSAGFLIAPQKFRFEHRNTAAEVFRTLQASFDFAKDLKRDYNIEHFLLTPPINMTLSKTLASHLNSNIWSEAREERIEKSRFKNGKTAFAQKVVKAPEPSLIFGCTASKRGQFNRGVEAFLTNVKDKEAFAHNFARNMTAMKTLLEAETCLFIDFHALIGVDGTIYHLDFDRCFSNREPGQKRSKKPSSSCLHVVDHTERKVQELLEAK